MFASTTLSNFPWALHSYGIDRIDVLNRSIAWYYVMGYVRCIIVHQSFVKQVEHRLVSLITLLGPRACLNPRIDFDQCFNCSEDFVVPCHHGLLGVASASIGFENNLVRPPLITA